MVEDVFVVVTYDDLNEAINQTLKKMGELGAKPELAEAVRYALGYFVGYLKKTAIKESSESE